MFGVLCKVPTKINRLKNKRKTFLFVDVWVKPPVTGQVGKHPLPSWQTEPVLPLCIYLAEMFYVSWCSQTTLWLLSSVSGLHISCSSSFSLLPFLSTSSLWVSLTCCFCSEATLSDATTLLWVYKKKALSSKLTNSNNCRLIYIPRKRGDLLVLVCILQL